MLDDLDAAAQGLADAVTARDAGPSGRVTTAVVASAPLLGAATVAVRLDGGTVPVAARCVTGVVPAAGARVLVWRAGGRVWVLGEAGPVGPGGSRVPSVQARRTSPQGVPDAPGSALLSWTTADHAVEVSVVGSRLTVGAAGRYLAAGVVGWASNGTGYRTARWLVNGAAAGYDTRVFPQAGQFAMPAPTLLLALDAGDYVELQVTQSSGGSLNAAPDGNDGASASLAWVGA